MSGPDDQYRYLQAAMLSAEAHAEGDGSELAAVTLHLVACIASVDAMCRDGDLPGAWQAAVVREMVRQQRRGRLIR